MKCLNSSSSYLRVFAVTCCFIYIIGKGFIFSYSFGYSFCMTSCFPIELFCHSLNRQDFPEHRIEPRQRRQPQQYMKPDGVMEKNTSNHLDYPEHELSPRKSYKPSNSVQRSEAPLEDITTARQDYPEHKVEPRQRRAMQQYVKPEGKMEGVSTNRLEYPEHQLTPRQTYKPANAVVKSDDPFEDKTTARLVLSKNRRDNELKCR